MRICTKWKHKENLKFPELAFAVYLVNCWAIHETLVGDNLECSHPAAVVGKVQGRSQVLQLSM